MKRCHERKHQLNQQTGQRIVCLVCCHEEFREALRLESFPTPALGRDRRGVKTSFFYMITWGHS